TCGEDIDILENFIKNNPKFKNMEILEKYYGKIPVYDKEKVLVKDRVILIGDAASQVKPTTGGGLILGFKSCEIAKNVIVKVLKNDNINLLKNYEKEFKKTYNKELNYQLKVQKTLNLLSDDDLDYFFNQLKEHDAEELISTYGDMDEQSILVKQFLKKGYLLSMFPSIIKRSVGKIWGLK
ncbi:MAG: geranylgeranyl reductase, partial [Methanobacteriaceae archaeon]|nr:geranylgeranyl reductase [Methanobacteriaceae archaeon]